MVSRQPTPSLELQKPKLRGKLLYICRDLVKIITVKLQFYSYKNMIN